LTSTWFVDQIPFDSHRPHRSESPLDDVRGDLEPVEASSGRARFPLLGPKAKLSEAGVAEAFPGPAAVSDLPPSLQQ